MYILKYITYFRVMYRVCQTMYAPDEVTQALLEDRKARKRGEMFMVSWSRSTSTSSIYRYSRYWCQKFTLQFFLFFCTLSSITPFQPTINLF